VSILDLIEKFNIQITNHISKEFTKVPAKDLGLDERCYMLFVNDDAIAIRKERQGTIEYYGGFEYVDKDCKKEVGDWVFYFAEDSRIAGHIARWKGEKYDEEFDQDEY